MHSVKVAVGGEGRKEEIFNPSMLHWAYNPSMGIKSKCFLVKFLISRYMQSATMARWIQLKIFQRE